jgi:competence protein ComEC
VAAIVATFAYLMLSGDSVPPQRSFVMTSLVLLAVLFDRSPLSMRLVAWAAMVVLLTTPDALTGASFQMSFAAVVALIAAYETDWVRNWSRGDGGPLSRLAHHVGALALTSLIATAATAPYAIYHFNRMSDYSLVANLLAVPLTSFWIMPWAVAAFLMMPLGLESLALTPMGWGIDGMLWVARTVAAWPGAVTLVPAMPLAGLCLITVGGLWLCLWRRPWRLAGLAGIAAGFLSIALATPPDLLVGDDGKLIAVRGTDGRLLLSSKRAARFNADLWLRRDGQEERLSWDDAASQADSGLRCDALGCLLRRNGHLVALVKDPAALAEDCRAADLVVSLEPVRVRCPSAAKVIDRIDLWRDGGHAVWLRPARIEIETVRETRGVRPWVVEPQPRPRPSPASTAAAAPPADPEP